jgi:ribose transport system substrate-binding protein
MKTKLLSLICVLMLACFLAPPGWGADKGQVFYLSPNQFDEFQTTASKLIAKYVTDAGYQCKELVAGNEDVSLQLNQLDNAITQKPKAIIIAACDGTAVVDGVEKARAQGIPVIAFDRVISETKVDFHSVAGCYRMGVLAAGEISRLLKEKHGEVKGHILDIMGDPGDSYTVLIEEGFQDTMKKYPNVKIETKIADGWEASNAADIADDYLVAKPDTDLIFSHAEHLAAAITSVLETKGLKKGEKIMVSTAGMPMGLDLLRDGWLQATVEQPLAAQAEGVAMFLEDIIAKKRLEPGDYTVGGFESKLVEQPYGPELRIPGSVITKANVDDPRFWGNQVGK